jgi:hypothetical protein
MSPKRCAYHAKTRTGISGTSGSGAVRLGGLWKDAHLPLPQETIEEVDAMDKAGRGLEAQHEEVRSPSQNPHQARASAGGESAPLIRVRAPLGVDGVSRKQANKKRARKGRWTR